MLDKLEKAIPFLNWYYNEHKDLFEVEIKDSNGFIPISIKRWLGFIVNIDLGYNLYSLGISPRHNRIFTNIKKIVRDKENKYKEDRNAKERAHINEQLDKLINKNG